MASIARDREASPAKHAGTGPESLSLERIVEHREAIRRFLLGLVGNAEEAEDLTQETLLRAHARLDTLGDETKLVPWLYRIATNIARDRFRRHDWRHRPEPIEPEEGEPLPVLDTGPRLDETMEQEEMSACVRGYLEELPDAYRTVILLHDVEGMTNPEIAELLEVSVGAIKIRLHRARTRLREALGEGCSFSTDERGVTVCEPRREAG